MKGKRTNAGRTSFLLAERLKFRYGLSDLEIWRISRTLYGQPYSYSQALTHIDEQLAAGRTLDEILEHDYRYVHIL